MATDLHKRLEEAAYESALKETIYGRDVSCWIGGFKEGAEFGYKEAINVAKAWLKENTYNKIIKGDLPGDIEEPDCCTLYSTQQQLLADFETDMNKIWEE